MKQLLLFILTLCPILLIAQVTLDECITKAKQHYPEVANYDIITMNETYSIDNATRSWIPQITLKRKMQVLNF